MGDVQHQVGERRSREIAAPQVEPEVAVDVLTGIHHPQIELQLEPLGDRPCEVRIDAAGARLCRLGEGAVVVVDRHAQNAGGHHLVEGTREYRPARERSGDGQAREGGGEAAAGQGTHRRQVPYSSCFDSM